MTRKTLEKQYLIEYQTKADCIQVRLDEYWPEMPPKSLIQEYYRLLDRVNELKKEIENANDNK